MSLIVTLLSGEEEVPLVVYPEENFHTVLARASELVGYDVDIKSLTTEEDVSLDDNVYQYFMKFDTLIEDVAPETETETETVREETDADTRSVVKIVDLSPDDETARVPVDEEIDDSRIVTWRVRKRLTCHYCNLKISSMKDKTRNYILDEKDMSMFYQNLYNGTYMTSKLICGCCLSKQYERVEGERAALDEREFIVICNNTKAVYRETEARPVGRKVADADDLLYTLVDRKGSKRSGSRGVDETGGNLIVRRKISAGLHDKYAPSKRKADGTRGKINDKKQKVTKKSMICKSCGHQFDHLSDVIQHCRVHQINNRINGIPCVLCLQNFKTFSVLRRHVYGEHLDASIEEDEDEDDGEGYLDESSGSYVKNESSNQKKEEALQEDEAEDYLTDRLQKYLTGELDADTFFHQDYLRTDTEENSTASNVGEGDDDDDVIVWVVGENSDDETAERTVSDITEAIEDGTSQPETAPDDETVGLIEDDGQLYEDTLRESEENEEDARGENEIESFQEIDYSEDPEYEPDDDADSDRSPSPSKRTKIKWSSAGKHKCDSCNKHFGTKAKLEQHKCSASINESERKQDLTCTLCGETFLSKVRLQFHRQTHKEGGWQRMGCDRCPRKDFASEHELFDHMCFTHNKPFNCPYEGCDKTFKIRKLLKSHIRDHGLKKYGCHVCGLRFHVHQTLKEHLVLHLKVKPFQCHICLKYMSKASRLRMHLLVHTSQQRPAHVLVCRLCDAAFKDAQEAEAHCDNPHECEPKEDDKDGVFNELAFMDLENFNVQEIKTKSDQLEGEGEDSEDSLVAKQNLLMQLSDMTRTTMMVVWIDKVFSCQYCEKVYYTKEALHQHRLVHYGISEPFQCHLCEARFITYARCTAHKSTHGYFKEGGAPSLRDFPVIKHYLCDICDKSNLLWTTVSVHYRHHHKQSSSKPQPLPCKSCHLQFSSIFDLARHRRTKHRKEVHENAKAPSKIVNFSYKCTECEQELPTKSALTSHQKAAHSADVCRNKHSGVLVCSECGKTYATKPALMTHIKWHTEHGIGREAAIRRRKRAFGKGSHICSICGLGFYSAANLRAHIDRIHDKTFKYTCEECGKGHFTHMEMETHKLTHTGERPFKCPECPRAYVTKAILNKHFRNHTGERPYSCNLCGATFKTAHSRNYHKMKHETGKLPSPLIVLEVKGGNSKKLTAALHAANYQKDKETKQRSSKRATEARDYIKEEMDEFQDVNEEEVLVRTSEVVEMDDSMIAIHEETQEGVQIVYKRVVRSLDENGCENEYTIECEDSQ